MKVWQAGSASELRRERGARGRRDWSWRAGRRRRRLATLGSALTRPYPARTALSLVALLAYTIVALAPPYLAKLAVDEGIRKEDSPALAWIVGALPRLGAPRRSCSRRRRPTSPAGWVSASSPICETALRAISQRLSLGFFERNRTGAIISRITNDVEALDQLVTDGVTSLVQNRLLLVGTAVVSSSSTGGWHSRR